MAQGHGVQVHGHRGARAERPENTLPAFEYAIAQGVDVLELDLAVTRDNVLVVSHDPVLSEVFCQGGGSTRVIREMTAAELRRWDCGARANPAFPKQRAVRGTRVPTLDEVLALAPRGRFHFNIETKIFRDRAELTPPPDEFARMLVEAIRRHGVSSRTIIQSFDFRTLRAAKRLAPEIRRSALFGAGDANRDLVRAAKEAGATILSPHHTLVTRALVSAAHEAGWEVVPWTANRAEEWSALVEAKVDGIITDDPVALIGWLRDHGRR